MVISFLLFYRLCLVLFQGGQMRYYLSLLLLIVLYISSSTTCQGRSLASQSSNFCSPNNSVRDACYAGLKHPICFFFTSLSLFPFIYLIILLYRMLTLLFTSQKTVDYHSSIFQSKAWVSLSHLYVTSFNLSAFLTYVSREKYSSGNSLRKASDSPYLFGVIFQF